MLTLDTLYILVRALIKTLKAKEFLSVDISLKIDLIWIFSHGLIFPRVQFELWDSDDAPVPRKELLQKVKGVDGLVCVLTEKIDAELLEAAGLRAPSVILERQML